MLPGWQSLPPSWTVPILPLSTPSSVLPLVVKVQLQRTITLRLKKMASFWFHCPCERESKSLKSENSSGIPCHVDRGWTYTLSNKYSESFEATCCTNNPIQAHICSQGFHIINVHIRLMWVWLGMVENLPTSPAHYLSLAILKWTRPESMWTQIEILKKLPSVPLLTALLNKKFFPEKFPSHSLGIWLGN